MRPSDGTGERRDRARFVVREGLRRERPRTQAAEWRRRDYPALVREVREVVRSEFPRSPMVLVISKGDDSLLELDGRDGRHFPGDGMAARPGYYPPDDEAAIEQLEAMRELGAGTCCCPAWPPGGSTTTPAWRSTCATATPR